MVSVVSPALTVLVPTKQVEAVRESGSFPRAEVHTPPNTAMTMTTKTTMKTTMKTTTTTTITNTSSSSSASIASIAAIAAIAAVTTREFQSCGPSRKDDEAMEEEEEEEDKPEDKDKDKEEEEDGCNWQGEFSELNRHLDKCPYQTVNCEHRSEGCAFQGRRRDYLERHQQECEYTALTCSKCSKDVLRKNMPLHQQNECENALGECTKCCLKATRKRLREHTETECPYAEVACEFQVLGCCYRAQRLQVDKHATESVQTHLQLSVKRIKQAQEQVDQLQQKWTAASLTDAKAPLIELIKAKEQKQASDKKENQRQVFHQAQQFYQSKCYAQALELLIPLVREGFPEAVFRLGFMYSNGFGVPTNHQRAFELFCEAAEHGIRDAMVNIGILYEYKKLTAEADYVEAARWYAKAEDRGSPEGTFNLARLHEAGMGGLRKNPARALQLYRLAQQRGFSEAQASITRLSALTSANRS